MESIQQISDAVTSKTNQIIYYSFEDVPDVPDKQIPLDALKKAVDTWESNNPHMEFIESSNPNIEIKWQKYASSTHTGLATCNSVLFGILSHCVLDISIGARDCNSNFVQSDENMVANILMHEIGHALGLEHTDELDNLMYSTESPKASFNSKGYAIPERFEGLFVGQKTLLSKENELKSDIESLDIAVSHEQLRYDQYYKQYEYYDDKILSSEEFRKAELAHELISAQVKKINELIAEQNVLITEVNDVVDQLGCNPNFEIKSPYPNNKTSPTANDATEIPIQT